MNRNDLFIIKFYYLRQPDIIGNTFSSIPDNMYTGIRIYHFLCIIYELKFKIDVIPRPKHICRSR